MERHHYKIPRHPSVSKFTIPVIDILSLLRDAFTAPISPVSGSLNFQRVINTGNIIGFDYNQLPTSFLTVLTDSGGRIITAFPGFLKSQSPLFNPHNLQTYDI
ncbi:adhesin [Chitinophaga sp. Ak27]|nr:adhesin [Chitinophaga sp. Ak27]